MTDSEDLQALWRDERPRLLGLATAMLRDRAAAEDVVQEAFLRLSARQASDRPAEQLRNPAAWLSVATGNLCLDRLKSAPWRRERTGGEELWSAVGASRGGDVDPLDRVTLDDEIRRALLIVLERLTPEERVSFLLHDVFGLGFAEIAEVAGTSVANSRQLAHRARRKVSSHRQPPTDDVAVGVDPTAETVTDRFLAACRGGNLDDLVGVLLPDAWGVARTADAMVLQENQGGPVVAANLLRYLGPPTVLVVIDDAIHAFRDLRWFARLELDPVGDRVRSVVAVVDPQTWSAGQPRY